MKVNGKKIDIRNVSVPLLIIDAEKDDLVSTDSSIAVAEYVSSSTEFWRSSLIENVFDLNVSDPRQLEQKAKDEISDEKVKKSTLIITSIEDCIKSIEEYFNAGFTRVYMHSTSPDEIKFIRDFCAKVLPYLQECMNK
jgi:hypothetical protein